MLWFATLAAAAAPAARQLALDALDGEHVDFLEIGCSDFNTAAQLTQLTGISVEPIPIYLDALPARQGLRKMQVAASNESGVDVDVYWSDSKAIEPTCEASFLEAHGMTCCFPQWVRGCNQLGSFSEDVARAIEHPYDSSPCVMGSRDDDELFHVTPTRVLTVGQILEEQRVASLNFVKVDTEGYDGRIVNSLLDAVGEQSSLRPDHIKYEYLHLETNERTALSTRLDAAGFACESDEADTTCTARDAITPLPWILGHTNRNSTGPEYRRRS